MRKTRVVYVLELFEERGGKEQCELLYLERLKIIGLMVFMLMSYSRVVSVVSVLWGVGPILRNGSN